MPRIRFTADPKLPADLVHLGYRKGTEVDLSDDQANRWLRRGVATVIPAEVKADTVPATLMAEETVIAADSQPGDTLSGDSDTLDGADTLAGAAPARGRRGRQTAD